MSACTFFGHRECFGLDVSALKSAIEGLIGKGVDAFYVGNQGQFDGMVFSCLKELEKAYPHIAICVVLAYLPAGKPEDDPYAAYSIYPEGLERCPRKFAIERRNRWMIEGSDYCICYITHSWGSAYQFFKLAKRKGLVVVNLGNENA